MDSGELIVSSGTLLRVFLLVLYCTVGLIYFRTILPRLTPISKRLASVFLAAQIFVIVMSLEFQPASRFEEWLWHLDFERNIPTTLAATQLTLVGCIALLIACLAKARRAWHRVYFVAIGWLFLHLARDEFYTFHEGYIAPFQLHYAELGAAAVVATLLVARRSPRSTWMWHLLLLVGLAVSASGCADT